MNQRIRYLLLILLLAAALAIAPQAADRWRAFLDRPTEHREDQPLQPLQAFYDLSSAVYGFARSETHVSAPAATAQAESLLQMAVVFQDDWNYGNALHLGHLALGRVAFHTGDLPEARRRLLLAADTPGSPQLNDYGPDMTLAHELLLRGETEAVLTYLARCKRFWLNRDKNCVDDWVVLIRAGGLPFFGGRPGLTPRPPVTTRDPKHPAT